MGSSGLSRLGFLTAALLVGGAFMVWASDILAPFIVAFILAYLFDPLVTRMEKMGVPRGLGCVFIVILLVLLCIGVLSVLGPIIYTQLENLLKALPAMIDRLVARVRDEILPHVSHMPFFSQQGDSDGLSFAAPLASSVLSGGLMVLPKLGLAFLTPVILFYLLRDWPKLITALFDAVPQGKRPIARRLVRETDRILSGFLRGQAWVCVTVAVVYASGFMIVGLQYGLVIGIFAGFMKYLPYIGTAISLLLAVMTGLSQEEASLALLGGVGLTFLIAEFLESSVLTPRLVGERVDVQPAAVILVVLLGGKLMGVLGVFLAVPVFATLRLFVREIMAPVQSEPDPPPA